MRQGTIVMLYKGKGDKDTLDNWRPLTMMSRWTLVLANIMTTRLERFMDQVIQQDQTAFVPGRQMHENVVKIMDALSYTSDHDIPAALLSVDCRGAYDCVSHETMFTLLDIACEAATGAPSNRNTQCLARVPTAAESAAYSNVETQVPRAGFTCWVVLLTERCVRRIMVNGSPTDSFELEAGVPQGSSLSPALFTVFCNSLGVMLQLHLRGVKLPLIAEERAPSNQTVGGQRGGEHATARAARWSARRLTTVRFADDVNVFVRPHEISLALDIMECWCAGCAMGLNAAKSVGMWAGSLRERTTPWASGTSETPGYSVWRGEAAVVVAAPVSVSAALPPSLPRCAWLRPGTAMKVLGVDVGYGIDYDALWKKVGTNMLTSMRMWGRVRLSLLARVMVLKTMVYSLCWFLAAYCPHHLPTLQLVRKAGLLFLHRGMLPAGITISTPPGEIRVPSALNYPAVSAKLSEGGLAMWDPLAQIQVLHAKWIWLLLQDPSPVCNAIASWQHLPRYYVAWHTCRQDDRTRELGALVDGQGRTLTVRLGSVLPPLWQRALRAWVKARVEADLAVPTMAEHVPSCSLWDNVLIGDAEGPLEPPPGWMRAGVHTVNDVWDVERQRARTLAEVRARAPVAQSECVTQDKLAAVLACVPEQWKVLACAPPEPHEDGEWLRVQVAQASGDMLNGDVYRVHDGLYDHYDWDASEHAWRQMCTHQPEWLNLEVFQRVRVQTHPKDATKLQQVVGFTKDVWARSASRLTWLGKPFQVSGVRRALEAPRDVLPAPAERLSDALRFTPLLTQQHRMESGAANGTVWGQALLAIWKSTWPPAVRDETWRLMVGSAYFAGYRRHFDVPSSVCRHCMVFGSVEYDTPAHAYTECTMLGPLWTWARGYLGRMGFEPHSRDGFMLYGALAPTTYHEQSYAHQLTTGHPVMAVRGAMAAGYSRWRAIVNRPPKEDEERAAPPPPNVAAKIAERLLRRMVELDFLEATVQILHREPKPKESGEPREQRPRPEGPHQFDAKWVLVARARCTKADGDGGPRARGPQRGKAKYELVFDADG
jgi:hypothetical protein